MRSFSSCSKLKREDGGAERALSSRSPAGGDEPSTDLFQGRAEKKHRSTKGYLALRFLGIHGNHQ